MLQILLHGRGIGIEEVYLSALVYQETTCARRLRSLCHGTSMTQWSAT